MTIEEFSDEFDIQASSYRRFKGYDAQEILDSVEFSEYEKSVFLTKAQEMTVISLYQAFETSEQSRKQLDSLLRTADIVLGTADTADFVPAKNLKYYTVSFSEHADTKDIMFIVYETATFSDNSLVCYNDTTVAVVPVRHDELVKVVQNPFRGPNTSRVIRVDSGYHKIGLISKYDLGTYYLRYIAKPAPIILAPLGELTIDGVSTVQTCTLDSSLHNTILSAAVALAIQSKSAGMTSQSDKDE